MANGQTLLNTAMTCHQGGRLVDAEKAYRKLLRTEPLNIDALRLLGGLYLQQGRLSEAITCLTKATKLRSDDPEILTNLGIAFRGSGKVTEALGYFDQALLIEPTYLHGLNNRAALYHDAGQSLEALEIYGHIATLYPERADAHYNYGNSLFTAGRSADAIARYERALYLNPNYMEAMVNLGMALSHAGKGTQSLAWLDKAGAWFQKALAEDPTNVVALNNMGNVFRQQGKPHEAIHCFQKALKIKPDYAQAAINLATSLRDIGLVDQAIVSCQAALQMQPTSADARINLAGLLQQKNRHREAIKTLDQALAYKPASLDAKWNKAISLLALGVYEEGWALHEVGLGIPHMRGENFEAVRLWKGEDFVGRRLLVRCEQGLGDSLQFIRYMELCKARGGTLIVLCPRSLHKIFKSCRSIDRIVDQIDADDFDVQIAMMSLPFIFKTTLETIPLTIPYLHADPAIRRQWAQRLPQSPQFKVGLVWAGSPRENQLSAHLVDRRRSTSLEQLKPLFEVEGVEFISLQMGAAGKQIDNCGLRSKITDIMAEVTDFSDTAAIIEQLDLVISVDTSVVHLAGAMGHPVWVLSRVDACWRWMENQSESAWYPSARVFGQKEPGVWADVVLEIKDALQALANSSNAKAN